MSTLNTGDMAPAFSGVDQDGLPVDLKDHLGGKVLFYFYPKDDTPGCTTEACNLRDAHDDLLQAGYSVIGVSPDTVAKHRKFATKFGLPFRLLADTDRSVANAYGVWGRKKFMGREYDGILRTTFLNDRKQCIGRFISYVRTKEHTAQVLGR